MNAPRSFRKDIPDRTKAEVCLRQKGYCGCGCGAKLQAGDIEYDHVPQLAIREWDEALQDTIPQANDPDFIVAKTVACHARKSFGTKATTAGSDAHVRAHINRIQAKNDGTFKKASPPMKGKGFRKRCKECGVSWADVRGLCPGCDAYTEHTGQI
jgi:rubrerythrin